MNLLLFNYTHTFIRMITLWLKTFKKSPAKTLHCVQRRTKPPFHASLRHGPAGHVKHILCDIHLQDLLLDLGLKNKTPQGINSELQHHEVAHAYGRRLNRARRQLNYNTINVSLPSSTLAFLEKAQTRFRGIPHLILKSWCDILIKQHAGNEKTLAGTLLRQIRLSPGFVLPLPCWTVPATGLI